MATLLASILAATSIGDVGRGAVIESLEPQPAAVAAAITPSAASARRPPRGPLQAPDPIAAANLADGRPACGASERKRYDLRAHPALADRHAAAGLGLAADHRQSDRSPGG